MPKALRIRHDHVIEAMVKGLGTHVIGSRRRSIPKATPMRPVRMITLTSTTVMIMRTFMILNMTITTTATIIIMIMVIVMTITITTPCS